ncbi:PROTEASOME BETA-TYPE SUBUNIT (MACROPAIN SUBUNIT PUP1) [Encephalitozoon cuniculi GB-M1]|uniref:Probable proteasome subunit beta type-2 n=2 Tax=Encephalitozoon cuniculi TaxID=6035 RepID=PSB2_ENCCU|nr:proteasome core particle subunit beta 2 [Encephalitozoon cuniculi GB-M1]Q8SQN7.1 RecName: Full=Probable proteasome subunit beta type-2; AltName: Full=26S proteasome beta-type subunit PUP1; AltName: Full=Multicatalytic endopeptidase complex subunit PUP1; Flags: Precursor [Encephalitozoon cuniculi GB-M1]AGE96455.1 proteasome beta-type subunit [Encephalitozoon cuniculi]KMV65435.1 proteasome subunit beta type-7 [Encephalitozoon cuniculi EcunIII-L]UYI26757.1 proteasome subunit beta [Encephalitozo
MITKTGTTIVGMKYKTGVILAADTRSTQGPVVSDKNCVKIHQITDKIMCCGAGTAADASRVARMASRELRLFQNKYLRLPLVSHFRKVCTQHLHKYGGGIGAALIVGGIDSEGCHLYEIHPHGSENSALFVSLGSGSLGAIATLESRYRAMDKDEAIDLACDAVKAGILNDLYSGSNIDVCVIDYSGVEFLRNYRRIGVSENTDTLVYPLDSVRIKREEVFDIVEEY